MEDAVVLFIGWTAAAISMTLTAPQAYRVWKIASEHQHHRCGSLQSLSLWMWVLITLNAALWLIYAILTEAYPVGAPSLINGPLGVYVMVKILQDRPARFERMPPEKDLWEPSSLTKAWLEVDKRWRQ